MASNSSDNEIGVAGHGSSEDLVRCPTSYPSHSKDRVGSVDREQWGEVFCMCRLAYGKTARKGKRKYGYVPDMDTCGT